MIDRFREQARSHIGFMRQRRLVQVLADWCPYYPGLHLYYPNRRHVLAALKAFIDFVRNQALGVYRYLSQAMSRRRAFNAENQRTAGNSAIARMTAASQIAETDEKPK